MISLKVRWTLRASASSSGEGSTSSGSASIRATRYGPLGDVLAQPHPLRRLDEDADRAVGDLEHARDDTDHADVIEVVGARLVELGIARGDQGQGPLAGEDVVDQLHRALLTDGERGQRVRVGDRLLQRQDRYRRRQLLTAALADRRLDVGGLDDLDPVGAHGESIGTRRVTWPASGSSTRRIPSS